MPRSVDFGAVATKALPVLKTPTVLGNMHLQSAQSGHMVYMGKPINLCLLLLAESLLIYSILQPYSPYK